MLTISPRAMAVIRRVTGHPRLGPSSGLRIARRSRSGTAMRVGAVDGPEPGDRVVRPDGGRLYLEPDAAERVEERELDAVTDPDDRVQFVLKAEE